MRIQYTDAEYRELIDEFAVLSSYDAVAAWDQRASAEVERIMEVIKALEEEITDRVSSLEHAKKEHAEKSFFTRAFASRSNEQEITRTLKEYQSHVARLEQSAADLQEKIDFTPNSPEEKSNLSKEIRLRKKELQTEKRELAANMRAIRNEARVKGVQAGAFLSNIVYSSKVATFQRRHLRYAREAVLRPHEDARAAIERQLIQIEKSLLWVDRF